MKSFHNILFVSDGTYNESATLQQAVSLAAHYQACLDILVISPPLPKAFAQHQDAYEDFLKNNIKTMLETAKTEQLSTKSLSIDVEWGNTPDISIVQRVLRRSHDLLIKAAKTKENEKGFMAVDMALLRKCPCVLFLHRPKRQVQNIKLAVAIDPDNKNPEEYDLTKNLLKLADSLTHYYEGQLNIISCWDLPLEKFLRSSSWLNMPEEAVEEVILQERNTSYLSLSQLIKKSKIHSQPTIFHLKGDPTESIPGLVATKQIDVLIMGTVARTGITGFIIGNTAENVLQQIECSLWAMKPKGFISPVKAY